MSKTILAHGLISSDKYLINKCFNMFGNKRAKCERYNSMKKMMSLVTGY